MVLTAKTRTAVRGPAGKANAAMKAPEQTTNRSAMPAWRSRPSASRLRSRTRSVGMSPLPAASAEKTSAETRRLSFIEITRKATGNTSARANSEPASYWPITTVLATGSMRTSSADRQTGSAVRTTVPAIAGRDWTRVQRGAATALEGELTAQVPVVDVLQMDGSRPLHVLVREHVAQRLGEPGMLEQGAERQLPAEGSRDLLRAPGGPALGERHHGAP